MDTTVNGIKAEYTIIARLINTSSSVLDLGCGDGELLPRLIRDKSVRAKGIEIDGKAILECVKRGVSVFQDDIDSGLSEYEDKSFDFVILNQSLQQVTNPDTVLKEAMRVGRKVIIGIPNFAHINARFQIFFRGRTPVTGALPYKWYDTPNLHFLSILDFIEYCKKQNIRIEETYFVGTARKVTFFPNLFAQRGIFVVSEGKCNTQEQNIQERQNG